MAAKTAIEEQDTLTIAVPKKAEGPKRTMVNIFLPEIMGSGGDMKVDQYEHVTIANEQKENVFHIKRGVNVDVPVEVFEVLKARYPNL